MRSPKNDKKKKRIVVTASYEGLKKAETALIRLGFESKSNFAKYHSSRTTVTKFFQGKPISVESFKRICKGLELDWKDCLRTEEIIITDQEEVTRETLNLQITLTDGQTQIVKGVIFFKVI